MGQLAFIASQSDVFNRSELIDNLSLPEDTPALECALARNAFTKKELTRSFVSNLPTASLATRPTLPEPAWESVPFALPVFTVSSVEYQKLTRCGTGDDNDDDDAARVFTSPEQTELPALLSFLRYAALAHHRRPSNEFNTKPIGATLLELTKTKSEDAEGGEPWASSHCLSSRRRS